MDLGKTIEAFILSPSEDRLNNSRISIVAAGTVELLKAIQLLRQTGKMGVALSELFKDELTRRFYSSQFLVVAEDGQIPNFIVSGELLPTDEPDVRRKVWSEDLQPEITSQVLSCILRNGVTVVISPEDDAIVEICGRVLPGREHLSGDVVKVDLEDMYFQDSLDSVLYEITSKL